MLQPAGVVAAANRDILLNSLAVMLAVAVPTIIAAIVIAWWFRKGNAKARRNEGFVYSGRVELVVWSIPLLVILFLGGIIWVGSHRLDPRRPVRVAPDIRPMTVEVVSLDWRWLFIYPEQGIATVNRLVVPVGRPLRFRLTSASVMNAFFVPRLGSMMYAMNGMATELNLLAEKPGRYAGMSAHYSGEGFSDMRFVSHAVPQQAFDLWAEQAARSATPSLGVANYAVLRRQSRDRGEYVFRAVQPGLFDAIVAQRLAPADGPPANRSSTDAEEK